MSENALRFGFIKLTQAKDYTEKDCIQKSMLSLNCYL